MLNFIKKHKINSMIKKSVELYENGDFNNSLRIINKVLEISPNFEKALYVKGKNYQILGKFKKSLNCYDKITNMNTQYKYAWFEKATCFSMMEMYADALKALDEGLYFNENDVMLIKYKIRIFKSSEKYNEGLEYASYVLKNIDSDLGIELNASMLLSMEKFRESYNLFIKLSDVDSKNIDVWYGLSSASYYLGNLDDAIKYIEKCIELDNKNPNFLLLYSSYLFQNKSYNKALEVLDDSIKIYNNYDFHYMRGLCFELLNDEENAKECYEKALKLGLKSLKMFHSNESYKMISVILEKLGRSNEVEEYLKKSSIV